MLSIGTIFLNLCDRAAVEEHGEQDFSALSFWPGGRMWEPWNQGLHDRRNEVFRLRAEWLIKEQAAARHASIASCAHPWLRLAEWARLDAIHAALPRSRRPAAPRPQLTGTVVDEQLRCFPSTPAAPRSAHAGAAGAAAAVPPPAVPPAAAAAAGPPPAAAPAARAAQGAAAAQEHPRYRSAVPPELWVDIAANLLPHEVGSLRRVSRAISVAAAEPSLWNRFLEMRWGPSLPAALRWGGLFPAQAGPGPGVAGGDSAAGGEAQLPHPMQMYVRLATAMHEGRGPAAVDAGGGYVKAGPAGALGPTTGLCAALFHVSYISPGGEQVQRSHFDSNCLLADPDVALADLPRLVGMRWQARCGLWTRFAHATWRTALEAGGVSAAPAALVVADCSRQRSCGPGLDAGSDTLSAEYRQSCQEQAEAEGQHIPRALPGAIIVPDAVLAAVACSAPTALVLDVGFSVTRAVAVVYGRVRDDTRRWAPVGGSTVTNCFAEALRSGPAACISRPMDIMELKAFKEQHCTAITTGDDNEIREMELPLGGTAKVTGRVLRTPADALFDFRRICPEMLFDSSCGFMVTRLLEMQRRGIGLQHLCAEAAAAAAPVGSELYAQLLNNVVASGGTCTISMFETRLEHEIENVLPSPAPPVRVLFDQDQPGCPATRVWEGASAVALAACCLGLPPPPSWVAHQPPAGYEQYWSVPAGVTISGGDADDATMSDSQSQPGFDPDPDVDDSDDFEYDY